MVIDGGEDRTTGKTKRREDKIESTMREDGGEGFRTIRRKIRTYGRTLDHSDSVSSA